MLTIVSSGTRKHSTCFEQSKRKRDEDNLAWMKRHMQLLEDRTELSDPAYVALLGGAADADFRLRVAQAHVRHDLTPSHWSHAVLFRGSGWTRAQGIWEISLEPAKGFAHPPRGNGVQEGKLGAYRSPSRVPNVALIRLPVSLPAMRAALGTFKMQRNALDAVELMLAWLAYVWGVGRAQNPLLDGLGLPCAALIEALAGAAGFDLTPGLESRASCPEAIWQAARWWHEYYGDGQGEEASDRRLHGFWHTEHFLG